MASTPSSSSMQLSSISNIPPHLRTPAQQNLRYLQRRIQELEQELENKRVQLFQSEEARGELEERLAGSGSILTPASSTTGSVRQIEYHTENDGESGEREGEGGSSGGGDRQDNDQLLEEYRNVISHLIQSHNDKTRELEDNHSAEIDHIHADHQEMIMQLKDDHEVEHQAQMLVLDTLQTHIDHLQEEHQEMITQLKDDHEVEHQVQMQELDTLQTHIDHIQADHQETIKQLKDDHEVEHQAQVQELDTLSQTYQAKMSAMEAAHAATISTLTATHAAEMTHLRTQGATLSRSIHNSAVRTFHAATRVLEDNLTDLGAHTEKLKALFQDVGIPADVALTVTSPGGSTDTVDVSKGSSARGKERGLIMAQKQKRRLD